MLKGIWFCIPAKLSSVGWSLSWIFLLPPHPRSLDKMLVHTRLLTVSRTCSHESEGPRADEVACFGGVTNLPYSLILFFHRFHITLRYPTKSVWITHFGGVSFVHVKATEWGNLPNQGNQMTLPKPVKSHSRTTWLPTATSMASYFDETAKTLKKLTMLAS